MPSSSQPPISGDSHDPFEKFRVTEIQKEKEPRDASEGEEPFQHKPRSTFVAYIILILRKILEFFEHTTEQGLTTVVQETVLEHLTLFKAALKTLETEDRSQDSLFLNKLTELWHQLLEDSYSFRRHTLLSIKIRSFIKGLQHYPENQEHSLGYYLTEYAGQNWLPFPYMEMIRQLHAAHKKSQEKSLLSAWSKEIEEMIRVIRPQPKDENL